MIKVLMVCLGNICRSPMAEMVMRDELAKRGLEDKIQVDSKATSNEEYGNPIYPPAMQKLKSEGVKIYPHYASQITKADGINYDYIIGMEERNIRNINRIIGNTNAEVKRLLDYVDCPKDIADPWYTGNFDITYDEIKMGVNGLINHIIKVN